MDKTSVARLLSRLFAVLLGFRAAHIMLNTVGLTLLNDIDISISTQQIPLILGVYLGFAVFMWLKGTGLANKIKCNSESCFGISEVGSVSLILLYLGIFILIQGILGTTIALMNRLTIGPAVDVLNIDNIAQGLAVTIIGFGFAFFPQTITKGLPRSHSSNYLTQAVGNGFIVLGFWTLSRAVPSLVAIAISGIIQVSSITGVAYTRFRLVDIIVVLAMLLLGLCLINGSNKLAESFTSHN